MPQVNKDGTVTLTQAELAAMVADAKAEAKRDTSSDYSAKLTQTAMVNKATGKPNKTAGQWNLNVGSYRFKVGIGFENLTPTVANVAERLDILRANVARIVAVLDTVTAESVLKDSGFVVEGAPVAPPAPTPAPSNGSANLAARIAARS